MGKFEFRKHGILLDIEGVQVTVPATVEYAKRLEDAGKKMRAFGAQMKEENDVENGIDFMLDILDVLLGEDVMDAIEAKCTLDLYDCLVSPDSGSGSRSYSCPFSLRNIQSSHLNHPELSLPLQPRWLPFSPQASGDRSLPEDAPRLFESVSHDT